LSQQSSDQKIEAYVFV